MADTVAAHFHQEPVEPDSEYRAVEPWAIRGLILGLLSPAALLLPMLWLVPLVGLANLLAIRRLKQEASTVGRSAALSGLGLSVLFAAIPPARMAADYFLLNNQPREVADQFFEYLRHDDPRRALLLRGARLSAIARRRDGRAAVL